MSELSWAQGILQGDNAAKAAADLVRHLRMELGREPTAEEIRKLMRAFGVIGCELAALAGKADRSVIREALAAEADAEKGRAPP